jgi:hypothetical protein
MREPGAARPAGRRPSASPDAGQSEQGKKIRTKAKNPASNRSHQERDFLVLKSRPSTEGKEPKTGIRKKTNQDRYAKAQEDQHLTQCKREPTRQNRKDEATQAASEKTQSGAKTRKGKKTKGPKHQRENARTKAKTQSEGPARRTQPKERAKLASHWAKPRHRRNHPGSSWAHPKSVSEAQGHPKPRR